jgi:hypothetical protein
MSRRGVILSLFITLALTMTLAAREVHADRTNVVKASIELISPGSLAGKMLPAGSYTVIADEGMVKFTSSGKMMAEAAVQWKDETGKAQVSNLVLDGNAIREIHFRGQTRYVVVAQ